MNATRVETVRPLFSAFNEGGGFSGVPVESEFAEVLECDGDRITRIRMFRAHAEALEAAGA